MKLMEYQAKLLFKQFGLPIKHGCVIDKKEDLERAMAEENVSFPVVVKAQIQSGHRGQAGGIQFAKNMDEARAHVVKLLG